MRIRTMQPNPFLIIIIIPEMEIFKMYLIQNIGKLHLWRLYVPSDVSVCWILVDTSLYDINVNAVCMQC